MPSSLMPATLSAPRRHRHVPIDRNRRIARLVGARLVPLGGALVLALSQPRLDHGIPADHRSVVGMEAVLYVFAEQGADLSRVVGLPRLDVGIEPPLHVRAL